MTTRTIIARRTLFLIRHLLVALSSRLWKKATRRMPRSAPRDSNRMIEKRGHFPVNRSPPLSTRQDTVASALPRLANALPSK
jgi:hypothetical protein